MLQFLKKKTIKNDDDIYETINFNTEELNFIQSQNKKSKLENILKNIFSDDKNCNKKDAIIEFYSLFIQ